MKEKFYPLEASEDYLRFWFESKSQGHAIAKSIEFVMIGIDTYNLAFGDMDEKGDLDDLVVSNNGDMPKVIATVVQAIIVFSRVYPNSRIYFTGSSPARTRLYRAVLDREIDSWSPLFDIQGVVKGKPYPFERCVAYEGFLINRKKE